MTEPDSEIEDRKRGTLWPRHSGLSGPPPTSSARNMPKAEVPPSVRRKAEWAAAEAASYIQELN